MSKQIKYIAHCIEDGERFITRFKTKETDEHQLRLIGSRLPQVGTLNA